jgi:hypothetical protein
MRACHFIVIWPSVSAGDADGHGGIETINDGIKWVILDQVAAKQAIIGARFSGYDCDMTMIIYKIMYI